MSKRDYRTHSTGFLNSSAGKSVTATLAKLYESISHKRILSYADQVETLPVKIISVGNITFGGSGKTPHVEFLATHFAKLGKRTGIASGGWGGSLRKEGVAVSDGERVLSNVENCGDEAYALAESMVEFNVPVYAHWNRITAANELNEKYNCEVVIFDDGFHFVSVEKDADIVLIDCLNPFGGGLLPNRGMMREPLHAVIRADAVVLTNFNHVDNSYLSKLRKMIIDTGFEDYIFQSSYVPYEIVNSNGDEIPFSNLESHRYIPLSGLGNPESFEKSLETIGVKSDAPIRFNDHHAFSSEDINLINTAITEDNADGVITTSKDWTRLEKFKKELHGEVLILHSKVSIEPAFLTWLEEQVMSS